MCNSIAAADMNLATDVGHDIYELCMSKFNMGLRFQSVDCTRGTMSVKGSFHANNGGIIDPPYALFGSCFSRG